MAVEAAPALFRSRLRPPRRGLSPRVSFAGCVPHTTCDGHSWGTGSHKQPRRAVEGRNWPTGCPRSSRSQDVDVLLTQALSHGHV